MPRANPGADAENRREEGVRDREFVVLNSDSVFCVRPGVDKSNAHPLTRLRCNGVSFVWATSVDYMQRVGNIAVESRPGSAHHCAHSRSGVHIMTGMAATFPKTSKDLFLSTSVPVQPVIKH